MKPNKIFNLLGSALLGILVAASCENKEATPPAKAEGLSVIPGYLRAQVDFDVPSDAVRGKVFYGSGEFKEFDVEGDGTQTIMLESLEEQEYIFRVITYNKSGANSDPVGIKASVYGPKYESSLKNRSLIEQRQTGPNSVEFYFSDSSQDEAELVITYKNTSGKDATAKLSPKESIITLDDIDVSVPYHYYTVYKPAENCLDLVKLQAVDAQKSIKKVLLKSSWSLQTSSELSDKLVDDDVNTYWSSADSYVPTSIIIDMSSPRVVDKIAVVQAYGANGCTWAKKMTVEVGDDLSQLKEALPETKLRKSGGYRQEFAFNAEYEARYVKLTITEAGENGLPVALAEIDLANDERLSGENGVAIPVLVNCGPNPEVTTIDGALGDRCKHLVGWTHTKDNLVSAIDGSLAIWAMADYGYPEWDNDMVYQTFDLLPGTYQFVVVLNHAAFAGWADIDAVAFVGDTPVTLADAHNAPTDKVLGAMCLKGQEPIDRHTNTLEFTVPERMTVSVGLVASTCSHAIWVATATWNWDELYIDKMDLIVP